MADESDWMQRLSTAGVLLGVALYAYNTLLRKRSYMVAWSATADGTEDAHVAHTSVFKGIYSLDQIVDLVIQEARRRLGVDTVSIEIKKLHVI